MAIERKTEASFILPGKGDNPAAKVHWVVKQGGTFTIMQGSSGAVKLDLDQLGELIKHAQDIHDDLT